MKIRKYLIREVNTQTFSMIRMSTYVNNDEFIYRGEANWAFLRNHIPLLDSFKGLRRV